MNVEDFYWYITDGVNPEPWESPEGSVARAKGGKFYVQMHKPFKLRAFQEDFAESFVTQNPDAMKLEGTIDLTIFVWRNVDSSIKANIADATNMQKAIEDALQGILYDNDRQVIKVQTVIVEQSSEAKPAIVVAIRNTTWDINSDLYDSICYDAQRLLEMKRSAAEKHSGNVQRDPRSLDPGDSFF